MAKEAIVSNNTERAARLFAELEKIRPEVSLNDAEWDDLVSALVSLSAGELKAVLQVLKQTR